MLATLKRHMARQKYCQVEEPLLSRARQTMQTNKLTEEWANCEKNEVTVREDPVLVFNYSNQRTKARKQRQLQQQVEREERQQSRRRWSHAIPR